MTPDFNPAASTSTSASDPVHAMRESLAKLREMMPHGDRPQVTFLVTPVIEAELKDMCTARAPIAGPPALGSFSGVPMIAVHNARELWEAASRLARLGRSVSFVSDDEEPLHAEWLRMEPPLHEIAEASWAKRQIRKAQDDFMHRMKSPRIGSYPGLVRGLLPWSFYSR